MARAACVALALALAATPAAGAASASAAYNVEYQEFFSGIGSYYNASTQHIIQQSLQEQFADANPSAVNVNAADFPVSSAFTLSGVSLATWNSIPHIQDTFEAGLAQDLNVNASQVVLGAFSQTTAGLYCPFTVVGLGTNNQQANGARAQPSPRAAAARHRRRGGPCCDRDHRRGCAQPAF